MRHPICWHAAVLVVTGLLCVACGLPGGGASACDGLVYKDYGLDRDEYVPCAGEMVAILDSVRPLLESALEGDGDARSEAARQMRAFEDLWSKAGSRNLLERWQDSALNSLNLELSNAYSHYSTFLMLPPITYSMPEGRDALFSELRAGISAHDSAKNRYEGMLR